MSCGSESPCLDTRLCGYILNNYNNSYYANKFARVDMTSLYLTSEANHGNLPHFYHTEILTRTIIIISLTTSYESYQSGPWVDGSWVMGQMGHVNRWVTWVMGHGSVTHDP